MKKLLLLLLCCLTTIPAYSQHEADNWYFGEHAGITFKNGAPVAVSDGQTNAYYGTGAISDKTTGDLLFYTDGGYIWNNKHQVMKNGVLSGIHLPSTWVLIIPNPVNMLQYYLFVMRPIGQNGERFNYNWNLEYSLISMETPDGEVLTKNIYLIGGLGSRLTGTVDCSGTGYWVVAQCDTVNCFYSFHVTPSGVNPKPIISSYQGNKSDNTFGEMKISPNRSKLASVHRSTTYNEITGMFGWDMCVSLFDFNTVSGKVSNPFTVLRQPDSLIQLWCVAFSPDNTKLYTPVIDNKESRDTNVEVNYLYQYEINLGDTTAIRNSLSKTGHSYSNARIFGTQLGPDGKIYLADDFRNYLHVIESPNSKGSSSGYKENAIPLTGRCNNGFLSFIDYNLVSNRSEIIGLCHGSSVQIGTAPIENFSYSWTPVKGLSNSKIANPIANPTQTTEYTLETTALNGCVTLQKYVVKVDTAKVKIAPVSPICVGSSVQLSASGGDTYQWTPTIGLDSANKPNPIAKPTVTTRYKVLVTKGGCIDSAFVNVVVNQRPIARAGEDKITCAEGNRTQLGDTARAGESYLWSPPDGLSDPRIANPTALPKANTKYLLKVWNTTCSDTAYDEVVVTIIDKTQALISHDTAICRGGSVPLLARGGLTYSWFPTTGLSDPTIQDPIASPLVTTRYKVLVAIGDCVDSAFVTVSIYSGAHAGADKTVCMGASAELGEKPEAGNTYSWQPSTYLDNPTIANPQCTPQTDIQYILTVTSESGCVATDTVQVRIGTIVAKVSNDTAICSGSSVQLIASGGAKYTWSPSAGLSDSTIENPTASPNITTTYKVNVSSGTCEDSAFVTITVNPQPTAKAGQDKTLCIGASTEIGEASQAGFLYKWQPTNGLDDATKANPTASPTSTTQYILTVTGNGGCSASDTILVTIGTIKAIVSNDTSICEGASAKLFASGGVKYEWSPSAGLDNSSIANPTASPSSTTKYKVLVSSGTCIDSAFVTVTILPPPNANAGSDTTICLGASTEIGTPAEAGNSYVWSPSTGLSSPTASQTIASPATTTTYTLTVTNPAGCVKSDEVIVTVNPRNARSFTLQPNMVTILPGKQFTTNLEIPSGVNDWSVQLKYDSLLVKFNSITGAQAIPDDKIGVLLVSGNGGSRSIPITFDAFLPHTSDTIYPVTLSFDSSKVADCETWNATGNILMLADYCGKNIRVVSSTGKKYYLTIKDRSIDFGVGLSGNVRLEVFDYVGNSVLVVSDGILEAGEYSAGLDLPVGVYYCRMRAGMYESVGKVLIAR